MSSSSCKQGLHDAYQVAALSIHSTAHRWVGYTQQIRPPCFGRAALLRLPPQNGCATPKAGGRLAAPGLPHRRDGRGGGSAALCPLTLPCRSRQPGPAVLTASISMTAAPLSPGGWPVTAACHRQRGPGRQWAPARQGHGAGRAGDWLRRRGVLLLSDLIGGRGWSAIKQRKGPAEGN